MKAFDNMQASDNMQAYKDMHAPKIRFPVIAVYFKVIKKNLPSLLIYIIIFMSIAVMATKMGNNSASVNFQQTKSDIAFFDSDNTPLTKGLKASLSQSSNFVNVKDDKTSLSDALFATAVQYIVHIPKGFTKKFLKGGNAEIYKTVGQNENGVVNADLSIKRYLSIARLYNKSLPNISQESLVNYVKGSLSQKTAVTTKTYGSNVNKMTTASYLFRYLSYIFIIIIFMGVSSIMMSFNKTDLKMRNLVSPQKPSAMSIQIFAGHFVYTIAVWICGIALSLFLCGTGILGKSFVLLCLNLLCFSLACLSLSFLIGNFAKNHGTQNMIANVLSLGLAFVSGIFIPQEFLSKSMLSVAHFTPSFWYIKASTDICALSSFSYASLSPIINSMLIQLGFAAALFVVAIAIVRQKKTA